MVLCRASHPAPTPQPPKPEPHRTYHTYTPMGHVFWVKTVPLLEGFSKSPGLLSNTQARNTTIVATLPMWIGADTTTLRTQSNFCRSGNYLLELSYCWLGSQTGFGSGFGLTRAPHPGHPRLINTHKTICRNRIITNMLRCGDLPVEDQVNSS